jgi:hypothetical protein
VVVVVSALAPFSNDSSSAQGIASTICMGPGLLAFILFCDVSKFVSYYYFSFSDLIFKFSVPIYGSNFVSYFGSKFCF